MFSKNRIKKKIISIILIFVLASCVLQTKKTSTGISGLESKFVLLKSGISNKNDVTKILGDTILKDYPDDLSWTYIETEKKTNFIGKQILSKNNVLVLQFDKKGVLETKQLYDLNKINDLNIDETFTKSYGVNESFSKKFLASLRKRFQNRTNSQANK